jgi:hypothetical protein
MNTYEDDEFNRIEMESRVRKMSVAYNLEMQRLRNEMPTGIPFVTQDELEQLLKECADEIQTPNNS